jgi:hypothetical protein
MLFRALPCLLLKPSTPLELESRTDAYLMVDYNCTRRAKCLSKLGFCRRGLFVPLPLAGFSMKGGWIGCVIAVIQRIYPLLYVTPSRVASHPPLIGERTKSNLYLFRTQAPRYPRTGKPTTVVGLLAGPLLRALFTSALPAVSFFVGGKNCEDVFYKDQGG